MHLVVRSASAFLSRNSHKVRKNSVRISQIIAIIIALGFYLRDIVISEQNWSNIRTRGFLVVGIDPGVQPYSYYDANGWNGFDADIAKEIARRLQLGMVTDPIGYDALYDAVYTKRNDMVISALPVNVFDQKNMVYSNAYYDIGLRFVMSGEANFDLPPIINSVYLPNETQILQNKTIAVAFGAESDRIVRMWQKRVTGLKKRDVENDTTAIDALAQKLADFALVDAHVPLYDSSPQPKAYKHIVINSTPLGIGLHSQHHRLRGVINKTLDDMTFDGTITALKRKWMLE
jgi:polar amino acid transport system substrate-binding protein